MNLIIIYHFRCVALVEMNRGASRKFYEFCAKQTSLHDSVFFMLTILVKLKKNVRFQLIQMAENSRSSVSSGDENKENNTGDSNRQKSPKKAENKLQDTFNDNDETFEDSVAEDDRINDPEIVAGLLDVVSLFWVLRSKELSLPQNEEYRSMLEKKSAKILTILFKFYRNSEDAVGPVVYLCSMLPHSAVATIAGYCLSKLKGNENHETFKTYADALCNWGRGDDLCETVISWFKKEANPKKNSNAKSKRRGVRFEESVYEDNR